MMKVLQVVTWVAPGNPFGGPVRVAMNQVEELRRRGHEVELVAAQPHQRSVSWRSTAPAVHGFNARQLLPGAGFSGIVAPGLIRHVWRAAKEVDVVHVHLARDLVTLPAAAVCVARRTPFVVQCHGMIDRSSRRSARILDALLTKRVLRAARCVLALTEHEAEEIRATFPDLQLAIELLPNGVPVPEPTTTTTSTTTTVPPEVLFCSRLHRRKRPVSFVQMAIDLLSRGIDASFSIVGSDEGELAEIEALLRAHPDQHVGIEASVEPEAVSARLARCSVVVLPSVDEPFPMVVLEALAVGRPVVITESCGLADFVLENACGLVVPGDDLPALTDAVARLVADQDERSAMGTAGRVAVDEQLGMAHIGERLETLYHAGIGS